VSTNRCSYRDRVVIGDEIMYEACPYDGVWGHPDFPSLRWCGNHKHDSDLLDEEPLDE